MGGFGSGGQNKLTPEAHRLRGTWRADRHAPKVAAPVVAISPTDERRACRGLTPDERRVLRALFDEFGNWTPSAVVLARNFARSVMRLEKLQSAEPVAVGAVYREATLCLKLLRELELGK